MAKPWGRIELDYINHDKFKALNANAICLWHEGKNYCDVRLTDGLIPAATAKLFRFYSKKAVAFLMVSAGEKPGAGQRYAPLWEVIEGFGFKMHDYLEHNDGRDVVLARIAKADAAKQADADRKAAARAEKEAKRIAGQHTGHDTGHPPDTGRISEPVRPMSGSIQKQNQIQKKQEPEHDVRARGGPIIGRNPHISHAACDPTLSRCVPSAVHLKLADTLAPRYNADRDATKQALQDWYPTVWATLAQEFVMGDAFRFWQGRFDAAFASEPTTAPWRLTEDAASMDAGVLEILQRKGAIR